MPRIETAADVLIETIRDWGVDVIFGLPGDGINGIMETLRQRQDEIRFVQVRHEEAAAFMACAYAKYTGKLGCCLATSGPGGIHLLNGLYDAKLDGQPVLALTGMQAHDIIGTHQQQDVELDKLFTDACVYNQRIMGPAHVEEVANLACRTALSWHGVSHLTMPVDIQSAKISLADTFRSERNVPHHTSDLYFHALSIPDVRGLERAADVLNKGRRIAILCGRGANHAGSELVQIAERLGAPIIKALLGKAAVPDEHPNDLGGIGLLGTRTSQDALERCDTLLIVGSSFPYVDFYPAPGKANCVQIDLEPNRIGLRYPASVGLVGDSRATLQALLPLLDKKSDLEFLHALQRDKRDWDSFMLAQGTRQDMPMKPQVVAHELGKRLTDEAIVSSDSGTATTWFARHLNARGNQMYSCSGNLATMACGLPYTVAAQIAFPGRQCVGLVGDGGFSMLMAEFVTAVKYNLPIKMVIIKNDTLGQIKWEQIAFLGNPEFGVELAPIDFALFARACGGEGFTIEDPATCGQILDDALRVKKPTIIQAVVDPLEAPLPPKITADQAMHFAEALARGQPYGSKIFRKALGDKVREMV